jgi:isochorismate synthase
VSATRSAPDVVAGSLENAGDPFDLYDERQGVVLQHGATWLTAGGGATSVVVPAGADHVRRAADLAQRAFVEMGGTGIAMGALPYDGSCDAVLLIPDLRGDRPRSEVGPELDWTVRSLIPDPLPVEYEAAVEAALAAIETGEVEKVVLARSLVVTAGSAIDPRVIARRLRDAETGSFVFLVGLPGASTLVGASPELLVRREGRIVSSDPLAGTARRSADPVRDAEIARQLFGALKEQREHRLVADAVADALAPFCSDLVVDAEPSLSPTGTLWHLRTAVRGTLKPDAPDALTLAAALHPTPAICGTPEGAAAALIARLESVARRFYSGLVGWVDAKGDGEWAITLRCAEVSGATARLHAGAGIVAGSDPAAEDLETEAKFGIMLRALGVEPAED